ncbi:MAG: hypothetical protein HY554_04570 [Elusimicrobia bacterium]|nr:hypothetical protein [Elusimicrobiota bacterium]
MAAPLPRKTAFSRSDALVAAAIGAGTVLLLGWVLLSAELDRRASARAIVEAVAAANRKRTQLGRPPVTGPILGSQASFAPGELDGSGLEGHAYAFEGADSSARPCILASAARRTDGPQGTSRWPFRSWGLCASALGEVQRFSGACALSCAPPQAAPSPLPVASPAPSSVVERSAPAPPPDAVRPRPRPTAEDLVPSVPDIPDLADPRSPGGCRTQGCMGSSCCDPKTEACMPCPGSPCCAKGLGCGGTCQRDDDCLQGCVCSKLPGSPWGSCRPP